MDGLFVPASVVNVAGNLPELRSDLIEHLAGGFGNLPVHDVLRDLWYWPVLTPLVAKFDEWPVLKFGHGMAV
jgi:hypothetical protein